MRLHGLLPFATTTCGWEQVLFKRARAAVSSQSPRPPVRSREVRAHDLTLTRVRATAAMRLGTSSGDQRSEGNHNNGSVPGELAGARVVRSARGCRVAWFVERRKPMRAAQATTSEPILRDCSNGSTVLSSVPLRTDQTHGPTAERLDRQSAHSLAAHHQPRQ